MTDRLRVYIAGPISKGDRVDHLANALKAYRRLAALGFAPLCPHLSCLIDGLMPEVGYEGWLAIDFAWVVASDALLRLPGDSGGADRECAAADLAHIPVFNSVEEVIEWGEGR